MNPDGGVSKLMGVAEDISDSKAIEDALYFVAQQAWDDHSENYFEALAEYLGESLHVDYTIVAQLDEKMHEAQTVALFAKGEIVENIRYALNGTPCENVVGNAFCSYEQDVQSLFPEDHLLVDMGVEGYAGTPLWSSSGQPLGLIAVLDSNPLRNAPLLSKLLQIVSMRAAAEIERQQNESMLKLAASAFDTQEAVVITDPKTRIISVNKAFTEITGYGADEVIGERPSILASGKLDDAFYKAMWSSIINQGRWKGEMIDRRKNGDLFPTQLSITSSKDRDGKVINHVGVFSDITEKKEHEKYLRQMHKMDAIGTLVGGIAHEFNNMLAGISGNLYLSQTLVKNNPELLGHLDTADRICFRAAKMIRQLLVFSHKDFVPINLEPINLVSWLEDRIEACRRSIPLKMVIQRCNVDHGEIWVKVDTTQLQQILINLLNNARDACISQPRPLIRISVDCGKVTDTFLRKHPHFGASEYARLTVQDNGLGIPEEQFGKIFEPFYTTKDVGKGTGLGMPVVQGLVESYRGCIELESEVGVGSTFHIYIPLYRNSVCNVLTS